MSTGSSPYGAFQLKQGSAQLKQRIEVFDAVSNLVCYGDSKGNVVLSQIRVTDAEFDVQTVANANVP